MKQRTETPPWHIDGDGSDVSLDDLEGKSLTLEECVEVGGLEVEIGKGGVGGVGVVIGDDKVFGEETREKTVGESF